MQQKLAASLGRYQVRLYAYVFMRNHLHLLVEMGGLSGREAARQMGLASSAAVSRHLQALEEELPKNGTLTRLIDRANRQIRQRLDPAGNKWHTGQAPIPLGCAPLHPVSLKF